MKDRLPERLKTVVERRMRAAYHAESVVQAEGLLDVLARELDKTHPGAAASLREGLPETLTLLSLAVSPTLARTLRSTNAIESMIWIRRDRSSKVGIFLLSVVARLFAGPPAMPDASRHPVCRTSIAIPVQDRQQADAMTHARPVAAG